MDHINEYWTVVFCFHAVRALVFMNTSASSDGEEFQANQNSSCEITEETKR